MHEAGACSALLTHPGFWAIYSHEGAGAQSGTFLEFPRWAQGAVVERSRTGFCLLAVFSWQELSFIDFYLKYFGEADGESGD